MSAPIGVYLGEIAPRLRRFGPWKRFQRLLTYIDDLLYAEIAERRTVTDVADGADVLSRLLTVEVDGDHLTDAELRDQSRRPVEARERALPTHPATRARCRLNLARSDVYELTDFDQNAWWRGRLRAFAPNSTVPIADARDSRKLVGSPSASDSRRDMRTIRMDDWFAAWAWGITSAMPIVPTVYSDSSALSTDDDRLVSVRLPADVADELTLATLWLSLQLGHQVSVPVIRRALLLVGLADPGRALTQLGGGARVARDSSASPA